VFMLRVSIVGAGTQEAEDLGPATMPWFIKLVNRSKALAASSWERERRQRQHGGQLWDQCMADGKHIKGATEH
jgi:hypothetical protein